MCSIIVVINPGRIWPQSKFNRHFEVERGENSASSSLPRSYLIKGEGNSRYACDATDENMWATVQVSAEYKDRQKYAS